MQGHTQVAKSLHLGLVKHLLPATGVLSQDQVTLQPFQYKADPEEEVSEQQGPTLVPRLLHLWFVLLLAPTDSLARDVFLPYLVGKKELIWEGRRGEES